MKKSARTKTLKPPAGLSREGASWWRKLVDEYRISDAGGLLLLETAMQAFDRARGAREKIDRDGELVPDRFGQFKAHALLPIERDARAQMLAALKQLNLDVEPLAAGPGRPAGAGGWRGDAQ